MSIITNWENDMIDVPEEPIEAFTKTYYPNYDLKLLSGLKHRAIEDIYDSLRDSRVIIMFPSLFDDEQLKKIVTAISHPIHVNNNGARREWDIREFVFFSAQPFEDLTHIRQTCHLLKDSTGEPALAKILFNCECHFYGFQDEHYELQRNRSEYQDFKAIRYS